MNTDIEKVRGMLDERRILEDEEARLREELWKLAISQNPELANKLLGVTAKKIENKGKIEAERLRRFEELERRKEEEHRRQRKISYDDKRNINALNGIRRSFSYIHSSRTEQIEMELNLYYYERGIEPPRTLLSELEMLRRGGCKFNSRRLKVG